MYIRLMFEHQFPIATRDSRRWTATLYGIVRCCSEVAICTVEISSMARADGTGQSTLFCCTVHCVHVIQTDTDVGL
jgi:hypothetical protein